MATFLEICQDVMYRDSGTGVSGQPTTVVGQTGRKGQIVEWVKSAWTMIQSQEQNWLWMQAWFSGSTVASQREYTGAQMGVASRFGHFRARSDGSEDRYTIYKTATGASDEGQLVYMGYDDFRVTQMRGTQTEGKPQYFTITPDGKLALSPIPDDAYTVQGPYQKSPQTLSADADEPEMPSQFHDLIAEVVLSLYLGAHDETPQIGVWNLRKIARYNALRRHQLPRVTLEKRFE